MKILIWVFLGGGLGSSLRYGLHLLFKNTSSQYPIGTFAANLIGCLLIGIFFGILHRLNVLKEEVETQRAEKSKFELVNIGHNVGVCNMRTEDEQILHEQEELEIYIEKTYHKSFTDGELPYDKTNSKSKLYLYEKNLNKLIFVKNDF